MIAEIREEEDPALGVSAATAADHLVVENDPSSSQQLKPRKRKYDEYDPDADRPASDDDLGTEEGHQKAFWPSQGQHHQFWKNATLPDQAGSVRQTVRAELLIGT